jgi:folate-binding protein YgfZ
MTEAAYGDVLGEYQALRTGAGLVEGAREAVTVTGPDAVVFLDGLLSQDLSALGTGGVVRALLLAPQGKLRATLWACRTDGVVLLADAGRAGAVVEDLTRFRLRVDVDIHPDPRPVLEVWGAGAPSVLSAAGLPVPAGCADDRGRLIADVGFAGLTRFALVGVDRSMLLEAGATPAGDLAVTAVRVEAGEPRMGRDIDERTIPQEAGLVEDAVSFTKGCYLGQELVARIDSRGHVNRTLRGVAVTSNVLPPEGAGVMVAGKEVGVMTSVAESPGVRAPIGLTLLRREVEDGGTVDIVWPGGAARARVMALPMQDFTTS